MLMKQPFFILGIDDVEHSKGSAFGAAGMFFFTFIGSILYLIQDSTRQEAEATGTATRNLGLLPSSRGEYGQVPLSEDADTPEDFDRGFS